MCNTYRFSSKGIWPRNISFNMMHNMSRCMFFNHVPFSWNVLCCFADRMISGRFTMCSNWLNGSFIATCITYRGWDYPSWMTIDMPDYFGWRRSSVVFSWNKVKAVNVTIKKQGFNSSSQVLKVILNINAWIKGKKICWQRAFGGLLKVWRKNMDYVKFFFIYAMTNCTPCWNHYLRCQHKTK